MIGRRRRVVVTGLGVATSLGLDVEDVWRAVLDGRSGIGRIRQFCSDAFPVGIGAEVDLEMLHARGGGVPAHDPDNRTLAFAHWAAERAWSAAGLERAPIDRTRAAVCIGAGVFPAMENRLDGVEPDMLDDPRTLVARSLQRLYRRPELAFQQELGAVSSSLALRLGVHGPSLTVHSACASATQAIGQAARLIRDGRADLVLTGGADSMMSMFSVAGFTLLGALSRNPDPRAASRPFDQRRDGFVLGEGAGMAVVEELDHARERGETIVAEVIGYGSSLDAFRFTDVHPDGRGASECMRRALDDAGISPEQVDYVNAHGTSTYQNDLIETRALKDVFGAHARRLAISSTKSQLGHLLCAAGGVEFVATVLALRDRVLPATINLEHPDPECDLDYVPNRSREADVSVAISNSFGFGGQNGTVVLRRYSPEAS